MTKAYIVLAVLAVGALVGGVLYLGNMDMPAPASPVQKVLADDRFPR